MSSAPPTDSAGPRWLAALADGSEMGATVAAFDWSATSLGQVDTWPTELRVAVRTCLSTRFPMLVVWGDDLVKIYNDGYREILGDKHPAALGSPVLEVWPEIRHVIEPMFTSVIATGRPTWSVDQKLVITRHGFPEECFFTFSYSPLYDDQGQVRGVVDIVTETTESVVSRRRLECLADVSSSLVPNGDVPELCVASMEALSRWPESVRSAELLLRTGERLVAVAATPGVADGNEVVVPVGGERGEPIAVLVATLNPERPFDAGYREFVNLLSQIIGSALDGAVQHAVEVEEYRVISDVLQQAMLEPASTFSTVAARYQAAAGNLAVGGDWYDVIELPGERRALVVGDCVGHGLSAAAAMSQLRAASRAMLLQGLGPGRMLTELSRYSSSVEGALCATAACVVADRSTSTLTYARAGHLPPLVVGDDRSLWLDDVVGPPLGIVTDSPVPERCVTLSGGEVVVMCSDGLVERRGESIDEGLERLRTVTEQHRGAAVHDLADALLETLVPGDAADDIVLVVKRLPSSPTRPT